MKGTHFQRPTELILNVHGEEWQQGDLIKGIFTVKNHGNEKLVLDNFGLTLAWGETKKVKAKDPKCFNNLYQKKFDKVTLAAGEEAELPWEYQTPEDCPLTDKKGTLYALYGHTDEVWQGGNLLLTVKLPKMTLDLLQLFENFLRFKVKEIKNKKSKTEIKFLVPISKEFASVEDLTMDLSYAKRSFELEFVFKVKKLAYTQEGVNVKGDKLKLNLSLAGANLELAPGVIDHDKVLPQLKEVFETVKMKTLV